MATTRTSRSAAKRPAFLANDNQPGARSLGQLPPYDREHTIELRSADGDALESVHGGQRCRQGGGSGRSGSQWAHTGQLCANGGRPSRSPT